MAKLTLTDATSLSNETSFLTEYNANNALIEAAVENTLSRDGTSPNTMSQNLDMNSNRITNLPEPLLSGDVVRLQDMVTFTGGGTISGYPTTSASLASVISDETGSGSLVFGTSPTITGATLTTPTITNPTVTTGAFSAPVLTSATVTTKISPTSDDGAPLGDTTHEFSDLFLASGGVINWNAGDVTLTHSANTLTHAGASSGYTFDAIVKPGSDDGAPLGGTSNRWSDLFLASGGVINWNNNDVTVTHATDALAFAGAANGYTFDNPFGYTTGAGGTVTQATSKATGVTLSKPSGEITLNNAALAAATIVSFTLTNTFIGATDVLVLNHSSGGTIGSYTLTASCAAGSAVIYVRNNTAGSLSEAIVIRYALIKGATT